MKRFGRTRDFKLPRRQQRPRCILIVQPIPASEWTSVLLSKPFGRPGLKLAIPRWRRIRSFIRLALHGCYHQTEVHCSSLRLQEVIVGLHLGSVRLAVADDCSPTSTDQKARAVTMSSSIMDRTFCLGGESLNCSPKA